MTTALQHTVRLTSREGPRRCAGNGWARRHTDSRQSQRGSLHPSHAITWGHFMVIMIRFAGRWMASHTKARTRFSSSTSRVCPWGGSLSADAIAKDRSRCTPAGHTQKREPVHRLRGRPRARLEATFNVAETIDQSDDGYDVRPSVARSSSSVGARRSTCASIPSPRERARRPAALSRWSRRRRGPCHVDVRLRGLRLLRGCDGCDG